jgi:SAM-dependent methyltransferase
MKICNHNQGTTPLYMATDYISGKKFPIVSCNECALAKTVVEDEVVSDKQFYPDDYYGKETRYNSNSDLSTIANYFAKNRVKHLGNLPQTGQALDIGCGQGWFLKQFTDRGWKTQGIEVSETAAFHARERLGLKVVIGQDSTSKLEDNQYDVIGLWHVLEHLEDPTTILNDITRLLKTNGKVLIGVPNFGSAEARWAKASWFHLDVPRHLYHFNDENIEGVLNNHSLKIVAKKYFLPEYDFFSFVQTVQNKMGLETNLLYRTLRGGSLSTTNRKTTSLLSWLSLIVLTPALSILSLFFVPLAALTKNGSSLILVLEKNTAADQ